MIGEDSTIALVITWTPVGVCLGFLILAYFRDKNTTVTVKLPCGSTYKASGFPVGTEWSGGWLVFKETHDLTCNCLDKKGDVPS